MSQSEAAQVFFYCTDYNNTSIESFMADHKIWHIKNGYILFFEDGKTYRAEPGETILLRRNQLVKASLMDSENGEKFEMVKILLTQDFLQNMILQEHTMVISQPSCQNKYPENFLIAKNDILSGFFQSLNPYIIAGKNTPGQLSNIKTTEILMLLEMVWPGIKESLFDFSDPLKLELQEFMAKNYSYNVTLERFAYLSGRSLATFKRDFKKIHDVSPHKWLMKMRLEEARRLIFQEKQAPSSVYLQVGFENLSHFSAAFKRQYGFNPSSSNIPS